MPNRLFQQMLHGALVGVFLLRSGALAQSPSQSGSGVFRVSRWTVGQGLPQNRIACLTQTQDGCLWLGTWTGLVRFDGLAFTVFNKFNTPQLERDAINGLAEDSTGTLWVATNAGLVAYRDGRFVPFRGRAGFTNENISRVAASRSGGLWVQRGSAVLKLEADQVQGLQEIEIQGRATVRGFAEAPDGWLDIVTESFWFRMSPTGATLETNCVVAPDCQMLGGCPSGRPQAPWIGTTSGLCTSIDGHCRPVPEGDLNGQRVTAVYQDHRGRLWAGTQAGLLYYRQQSSWQVIDLGLGSVVCLAEDYEDNLWVGNDLGLAQVRAVPVQTYTTHDGLVSDNTLSVCEGADGALWVGTAHGLSCLRDGRVVPLGAAEPASEYSTRCVWPDGAQGVWLAKAELNISQFTQGRFVERLPRRCLPASVNVFYGDRAGRLWAGTSCGAVAYTTEHGLQPCLTLSNATVSDVHSVLQTHDGSVWLGTMQQGLARLREGALTVFTRQDGLTDNRVWSLLEDEEGVLWIGTDNGFNRFKDGRFFAFGKAQGLPEGTVNCVLEDNAGDLWLSGLHGLHRAQREQLNAVADGHAARAQFVSLDAVDGMENPETNGGENQPAGWKAHDGRLWFPTVLGVVVVDPRRVPSLPVPPKVVIEAVRANGEVVFGEDLKVSTRGPIVREPADSSRQERSQPVEALRPASLASASPPELRAGHGHVLEFRYTANSFVAPEQARFRYRLVGADSDWREETTERTVRYINLRPGRYEFQITAANHYGVWNPNPRRFAFTLAPHFWQTWMFYLFCGCAVAGLAAGLQAYRLRWQHRLLKLEEQKALANERARIARDLHDDLGTALVGMALELNVAGRQPLEPTAAVTRFQDSAQRMRDLAERMREVVWAVNPKCDTVSSLASFLEQQVSQFLRADGLRVRLDFPEDIPSLPLGAEARHQLALNMREALSNVVRHAHATEVTVSLAVTQRMLEVRVKDNGQGLRTCATRGQGLANMRARMQQVGGDFTCECDPGGGTVVSFRLPLETTEAPNSSVS